jgi:hypothetical protein
MGPSRPRWAYYVVGVAVVALVLGYLVVSGASGGTGQSGTGANAKPVILYVNQGNGSVNGSNFGGLLDVAHSHGFNTVFFQIYRSGTLLFTDGDLTQFVSSAHAQGLKIYFALYFTNSTQAIPGSIYADGEDGISLDMSTLPVEAQTALFDHLSSTYSGSTAITTTNPTLPLSPDLLVVETYGSGNDQYIHPGMIASVGVFATTSRQDYEQQFQYAIDHSDGVMVFDYAGLLKSGY